MVNIVIYKNINDDPTLLDLTQSFEAFIEPATIVDACTYFEPGPNQLKIAIPLVVLLACASDTRLG